MKELCAEYVNKIIEEKCLKAGRLACASSSPKILDQAIFFEQLTNRPTPEESPEYIDPDIDNDDPLLDSHNKMIGC